MKGRKKMENRIQNKVFTTAILLIQLEKSVKLFVTITLGFKLIAFFPLSPTEDYSVIYLKQPQWGRKSKTEERKRQRKEKMKGRRKK